MTAKRHARRFQDLEVYEKARRVAHSLFELSKTFPREETYSLTDQLRRASRSIGAQIAEAWGKRRYERHFVAKLTDADAEQLETQHWVSVAVSCGYITVGQASALMGELDAVGRMLQSMIDKAGLFCGERPPKIREETVTYYQQTDHSLPITHQ